MNATVSQKRSPPPPPSLLGANQQLVYTNKYTHVSVCIYITLVLNIKDFVNLNEVLKQKKQSKGNHRLQASGKRELHKQVRGPTSEKELLVKVNGVEKGHS